MKALSVRQPWADYICSGQKWLEFRSRPLSHRGKLLICSSKFNEGYTASVGGEVKPLPLGYMLAVVDMIDARPMRKADMEQIGAPSNIDGWYVWEFGENIDIVVPKPVIGRLNLFDVPDASIELAPEGKYWFDYI